MPKLEEFRVAVQSLTADDHERPFLCEGSPFECTTMIVGINPATRMDRSFWDFWDDGRGFDEKRFRQRYLEQREEASPTRKRRDLIAEAAGRCFQTNVEARPTPTAAEVDWKNQTTALFEWMFEAIKPSVVFVHGKPGIELFTRKADGATIDLTPRRCSWGGHAFHVIGRPGQLTTMGFKEAKAIGTTMQHLAEA